MGNRSWTDDEDLQLREMWATGITLDKIGRRLNRTKNAVSTRAKRIGLEKTEGTRQCRPWTVEEEEKLRLMWGEGVSLRGIAQAIDRTYPAVCCYTNKLGLPARAPKCTGGSRFKKAVAAHVGLRVANSGISTRLPSKKAMKAARKYAAKLFAPVDHSPEAIEARRAVSRMNHAKAQRNWVQDMFRGCEIPKSTLKRLGLSH